MSGKRKVVFEINEFYHVFNRSNGGEQIFHLKNDINRTLELLSFYKFEQRLRYSYFRRLNEKEKEEYIKRNSNKKPIVEILAYALMPNHFHLLLKENRNKGIQTFLSNFQNSFARFINIKTKRNGALFQRPFKATHIDSEEVLLHISRYIHLNPVTAFLMEFKDLKVSNITSFPIYVNNDESFLNVDLIVHLAGSNSKYEIFVENQVDYQRKLAKIKHLLLD